MAFRGSADLILNTAVCNYHRVCSHDCDPLSSQTRLDDFFRLHCGSSVIGELMWLSKVNSWSHHTSKQPRWHCNNLDSQALLPHCCWVCFFMPKYCSTHEAHDHGKHVTIFLQNLLQILTFDLQMAFIYFSQHMLQLPVLSHLHFSKTITVTTSLLCCYSSC